MDGGVATRRLGGILGHMFETVLDDPVEDLGPLVVFGWPVSLAETVAGPAGLELGRPPTPVHGTTRSPRTELRPPARTEPGPARMMQ